MGRGAAEYCPFQTLLHSDLSKICITGISLIGSVASRDDLSSQSHVPALPAVVLGGGAGGGTGRLGSISENLGDFESVPESHLYPCDSDPQASRKQVRRQASWIQGVRQTAGSMADLAPASQEKQSQVIGGRQFINPQAVREFQS